MALSNVLIGTQTLNNSWNSDIAPVHSGHNIKTADLIEMAAQAGSTVVRIPVDLAWVTSDGFPQWQIESFRQIMSVAQAHGIEIIFQPGQTPGDLSSDGTVTGMPGTSEDIAELAARFAAGVEQVYAQIPEYSNVIKAWEVGNEPNLSYQYTDAKYDAYNLEDARFFSVGVENALIYGEYLAETSKAIKALSPEAAVYGAGIAHNDVAYMDVMFAKLQELGAELDGFSIHPYTTYKIDNYGNIQAPESGRATDWVGGTDTVSEAWDHYYSFQGALKTAQEMMNKYGYETAELWITEFGVPSYLGNRNSGEDGELDQARWYAEAFGVVDSLDLSSLQGMIAHQALDNKSYEANAEYNAYDEKPGNDGTWYEAEGSFGLFHEKGGEIVAKPVVELMDAVSRARDYSNANIHSIHSTSLLDYSDAEESTGIVSGVIAMAHAGNDTITGSAFNDSLFAGNDDDMVDGGAGDDRIFGGAGNDVIRGGAGNDELYGNAGNDVIYADAFDRVDGGVGVDRVIVNGASTEFDWQGDGEVTLTSNGKAILLRNVEEVEFADGKLLNLKTGLLEDISTGIVEPEPIVEPNVSGIDETSFVDEAGVTQYLSGNSGSDKFIVNGHSDEYRWGATEDGQGVVIWNEATKSHDILYGFEKIVFNNQTIDLSLTPEQYKLPVTPTPGPIIEPQPAETANRVENVNATQYLTGEGSQDIFVIEGFSRDYGWGPTEDGTGIVVWHVASGSHDILWGFEKIAFSDQTIDFQTARPELAQVVNSVANISQTQYLTGGEDLDRFVINGQSADYGWGATEDGSGIVVWHATNHSHDILWDFDEIAFNDTVVELA